MDDRVVEFASRYRATKVPGTDDIYDFTPVPGEVTKEGTPLNKRNLLQDATAEMYGLDNTAVPDDLFQIIAPSVVASIIVTGPTTGSTVIAEKDGTVKTLTEIDGTWTFVGASKGTWTITASLDGETAQTTVEVTEAQAYHVDLTYIPADFSQATWEQIASVGAAGEGDRYWDIGDTHAVTLNGTVGVTNYNNQTKYLFIAHFNYRGQNGVYLMGFKDLSSGNVVGLCDSYYNTNAGNTGTKAFAMNHWGTTSGNYNTNFGGWKGCDLRYDILGSTNVAPSGYGSTPTTSRSGNDPSNYDIINNPVSNTLMSALEIELRRYIKPFTVYTDNTGNSSTAAANVTASTDYFVLPAEYEIFGNPSPSYANTNEVALQEQLAYYELGNSKITYDDRTPTSAVFRWGRSASRYNAFYFALVSADGSSYYVNSRYSYALTPLLRVAHPNL